MITFCQHINICCCIHLTHCVNLAVYFILQFRNDLWGKRAFVIGQINGVTLKRLASDAVNGVRACLSMYERAATRSAVTSSAAAADAKPATVRHSLSVGDVVSGT